MSTTVVNIRGGVPCDVYIGRWTMHAGGQERSKWANPYIVGKHGTREEVLAKYRAHVLASPELLAALPELAGKVLGCWCKPEACHGDVLVELIEERLRPRLEWRAARDAAVELCRELEPFCERIKIAGSIRRRKSSVKDIELVVAPRFETAATDLFGEVTARRDVLHAHLTGMLERGEIEHRLDRNGRPAFGPSTKRVRWRGMAVDVFGVLPPICKRCGIIQLISTVPTGGTDAIQTVRPNVSALRSDLSGTGRQELLLEGVQERGSVGLTGPGTQAPTTDVRSVRDGVHVSIPETGDMLPSVRDRAAGSVAHSEASEVDDVSIAGLEAGSDQRQRVRDGVSAGAPECGSEGQDDGTPAGDGTTPRAIPSLLGEGASSQRSQARQPDRESGDRDSRTAQRHSDLPTLRGIVRSPLDPSKYVCASCGGPVDLGSSWGVILAIRTGSAEFSTRFMTARRIGGVLPDDMIVRQGQLFRTTDGLMVPVESEARHAFPASRLVLVETPEEMDFFEAIGLPWVEPEER